LIRFDRRVRLTLLVGFLLFAVQVGFKLHGSSIGMWNQQVIDSPAAHPGELFGKAHLWRADEWFVSTPWTLSQVAQGMPWHSENIGGKDAAALAGVAKGLPVALRPALWGFLVLDLERGFAFDWNYYTTAIFFAVFFVLLLLTDNHYLLSLVGAAWITWSAYNQWWDGMGALIPTCAVIIGVSYLLFASTTTGVIVGALVTAYFSVSLAVSLYLPWLVGFGYLMLAIVVGLMLDRSRRDAFRARFRLRAGAALLALALIAAGTAAWYLPLRETIQAMAHTEYPGKRVVTDAYLTTWPRVFSGFYDAWYGEKNFPVSFRNVCEASSMILLFPVVLLALAAGRLRKLSVDRLLVTLLLFCLGMLGWMTLGLPAVVAKVTLLDRAPPLRCTAALGVASILLTLVYLSREGARPTGRWRIAGPLVCAALLLLHGWRLHQMDPFFTWSKIALITAWGTAVSFALLERRVVLFSALILAMIAPNWLIHPTGRGLGAFLEKKLWTRVRDMNRQEPSARWAVFGNVEVANFLKTTGATVINGSNFVPDLERWKPLDPDGSLLPKYNRYGHTHLMAGHDAQAKFFVHDGSADLGFPPDRVYISVDPCSEQFRGMNVRYLAFSPEPADKAYTCLTPIGVESGVHLYRLGS
jgi:hypothetical protein